MKISAKGFIYHKKAEKFVDCFDRYGYNTSTNKFAISDGVSKSFFPDLWAEILVEHFLESSGRVDLSDTQSYIQIQNRWIKKVSRIVSKPNQKYFVRNFFIQGRSAAATFVGLHFFLEDNILKWEAVALGDSFLFFIPENTNFDEKNLNNITYLSSKQNLEFNNFPDYFDSRNIINKGKIKQKKHELKNGTFYLMTDALAEWFVKDAKNANETIKSWKTQRDFEESIEKLRNINLVNDDSSIIIIQVLEENNHIIEYESLDISNYKLLLQKEEEINSLEHSQAEKLVPINNIQEDFKKELNSFPIVESSDYKKKKKSQKKKKRKKRR